MSASGAPIWQGRGDFVGGGRFIWDQLKVMVTERVALPDVTVMVTELLVVPEVRVYVAVLPELEIVPKEAVVGQV
jgi:hypothetical protein